MRAYIVLALIVTYFVNPSMGYATNVVENKVILEIQPEEYYLDNYFHDDASQILIDNGYTFLARLKGQYLGHVTMEDIGYWLEYGSYGILQYGGHGTDEGATGGQTFETEQEARDELDRLVNFGYFLPGDLDVISRTSYHALYMMPAYTNNSPSGCDVAFISTCHGEKAGSFRASCKVAGTGDVTNAQLISSFNCLVGWLEHASYRTIDLAAAKCSNDNPSSWAFTVTNGNWQLFDYTNPAATVYAFSVSGGFARWVVTSEYETERYVVEGSPAPAGPWHEAAAAEPAVGDHAVAVPPHPWYRLLEIERGGGVLSYGLAVDSPPAVSADTRRLTHYELREVISARRAELEISQGPGKVTALGDTLLIVTTEALSDACSSGIADYWRLRGAEVSILTVDGLDSDPNIRRGEIHAAIVDAAAGGVNSVLLVGDSNDHVQFDMEKEGPQWWPESWMGIRDGYLARGFPADGQPEHDLMPAWYEPDTLPRPQSTAYTVPYVPYLSRYADVDGDGVPDLRWGCLPLRTAEQVLGYACKLWSLYPTVSGAADVAFYICDRDYQFVGTGAIGLAAAEAVEAALPSWVSRHYLYLSDIPDDGQRNTAAAEFWNQTQAGIHVLMGSFSHRYMPADFFDKAVGTNPWHMGMLDSYANYYPLVIANSCSGGDWARTEDPAVGAPVLEDFLAAHDRGALAWVGPSVGTWQHANAIFGEYLIEELYADPVRSMAASFLAAQRRMLEDPQLDSATKLVARMMCFFGDPLAPLNELAVAVSADPTPVPPVFGLVQNVPNPFNPVTTIRYTIARRGHVSLKIYDAAGRLVRTLVDEEQGPRAGGYTVTWNGTNEAGRAVASGVYFCRLSARGQSQTKKVVVLR